MAITEEPAPATDTATARTPDRRLGVALLVIASAQLMIVLDGTIVTVALPSIQGALGMAPTELSWVLTAYALALGGLLLAGGRIGDLFGHRRVFRVGLVVFALASLLGGLATTGELLIAARAAQGAGAAIVAPSALSLLTTTFPAGPARHRAIGVYGAMGGLGAVVGLLLGGVLTDYLDWRWILLVNLPIAAAILLGTTVLGESGREGGRVDWAGTITATAGLSSLVYSINRSAEHGWTDPAAASTSVTAAVLLTVFVLLQRTSAAPMLPLGVLADRGRAGANLSMFLMGGGMLATFYFLTLYMQEILGYEPMLTGIAYLPFAVGIGVAAGWVGPRMLAQSSLRTVAVSGMLLAATGMAWFGLLTPASNPWAVLLPAQLVAGIGLGLGFVTITIAGIHGVADRDAGVSSGLLNTSQQIGGALGLAVLAAVATATTRGRSTGLPSPDALTEGYTAGILVGGCLYVAAAVLAAVALGRRTRTG